MHFLFFFIDGIGLGGDDARTNPLVLAAMPNLEMLLNGHRLTASTPTPLDTPRASLLSLDANLGITGLPQSATGQATLLTGFNVPQKLGYHYGPKPNGEIREILKNTNIFKILRSQNFTTALLNAYPPRYFQSIHSGKRLFSAIPLSAYFADVPLKTIDDLYSGQALSADFTGMGWRTQLGFHDAPLLTPQEAGTLLASLAFQYHFSFFEYWPSDIAGHQQDMQASITILETFDQVLGGLLKAWDDPYGLILITSDHGNLEDISSRKHSENPVPCLLIGSLHHRRQFSAGLHSLDGITPRIVQFFQ